jgi:hypothetical protein
LRRQNRKDHQIFGFAADLYFNTIFAAANVKDETFPHWGAGV